MRRIVGKSSTTKIFMFLSTITAPCVPVFSSSGAPRHVSIRIRLGEG
jgi:hypothetical protein